MMRRRQDAKPVSNRTDVTPAQLRGIQEDAYLKAILESTVEGIIVIDDRGRIETFNRAAQQMFGYKPEEVVGRNISMLMPEPFRGSHDRYMTNYLRTGEAKIIGIGREVLGQRKDGSNFPIELAVSEVNVEGRRTFTGLVKDITERKTLEKEILEVSEREQHRIGRELHDGVCQELAGIAFQVKSLQQKLDMKGHVESAELSHVVELLQSALRHARGLSHGLYPVDRSPNGLQVALRQLAENTADVTTIACTFQCPQPVEFRDAMAATNLYRIAQEAVRDAVHQGHAKHIQVELSATSREITLAVTDDGLDLRVDGRLRSDMALRLMRHRADVIGAKLLVNSGDHGGVSAVCKFPRSGVSK